MTKFLLRYPYTLLNPPHKPCILHEYLPNTLNELQSVWSETLGLYLQVNIKTNQLYALLLYY